MKRIIAASAIIVGLVAFTGCAGGEVQITKCQSYDKGMCVSKHTIKAVKCEHPVIVNKQTYCVK